MTAYVLVALAAALVALWFARVLRRWQGSRGARVRAARATRGEDHASELLEGAGYRVLGRQVRIVWAPLVDGEPVPLELRADYLVERAGERLVAEVKTGHKAPSIETTATRRQLLEYRVAFGVDGVLLVCPERGAIHRIEFAIAGSRTARDDYASSRI